MKPSKIKQETGPVSDQEERRSAHRDERPFGREADRGIFVEGSQIIVRGVDEWADEASTGGSHSPLVSAEDHRHPYVANVFAECHRNAERLTAEGTGALNESTERLDAVVTETVRAQANLRTQQRESEVAEQAVRAAQKEVGETENALGTRGGERDWAVWVILALGFALEAVLLWIAFQNVELGGSWVRWAVIFFLAGLVTVAAHRIASWITIDWEREPHRRRLHAAIGISYAACTAGLLVFLAYIRAEDIDVAGRRLNSAVLFTISVLAVLFAVSVMASIAAGYAGYRYGRRDSLRAAERHLRAAKRTADEASARVDAAEAAERAASAAEEGALGGVDGIADCYGQALDQVPALAIEIGNHCLRGENRGFTVEGEYQDHLTRIRASIADGRSEIDRRHTEILSAADKRRDEALGLHS